MNDLIRREDVIKLVNQFVFGLCKAQNDEVIKIFNKYVEKIPTAYDIDKVVEELKTIKGYACYGMKCDECKYTHDCFEGEKSQEVAIDKAIEIVKQGGVYDDVCEWKLASDGEFIKNPHTKRLFSNEPSMQNVYCNTCGKKIKVVE